MRHKLCGTILRTVTQGGSGFYAFDIIFEAEDKLGIKVPDDQVDVKTIQDMTNLLDQLLAKKV